VGELCENLAAEFKKYQETTSRNKELMEEVRQIFKDEGAYDIFMGKHWKFIPL